MIKKKIKKPVIFHQDIPADWEKREELRNKGQFWTPTWIAKPMVSYVADNSDLVFDPATGEGSFYDALKEIDTKRRISYYGTDIDLEVLKSNSYKDQINCKVEIKDFITTPYNKEYSAIVANPPYIRHHRISAEMKQKLAELCDNVLGFRLDGRAGLHIYFLVKALSILKENGKLAFIMPADTCEGVFANKLWDWILEKFRLEAVITFSPDATPFPKVDTNAVILLIKNTTPAKSFYWIKSNESYSNDLTDFIDSKFKGNKYPTLQIVQRDIEEGKKTGVSREQSTVNFKYTLSDFANIVRGIATGANEYFTLTKEQVDKLEIDKKYLKRIVGRTSDVSGDIITNDNLLELDELKRPTYLISLSSERMDDLSNSMKSYLEYGESEGFHKRTLIKTRNPWYKMEKRDAPELLFAYLGRRNVRFIENRANVLPLSAFLCVYSRYKDAEYIEKLIFVLNHTKTIENLKLVGKSYGGGAVKVEPRALQQLPICDELAEELLKIQRKKRLDQKS